jgi:hypothetical protein
MIDHTLVKRGQLHLIFNQPLRLVEEGKNRASVSAKGAKLRTQVPSTRLSSSHPKRSPDPRVLPPEEVLYGNVTSSNSSVRDKPLEETPALEPTLLKRTSDASNSARKKQRTASHLGCPVCGGPHHLVKDCPVTAAGPKRYYSLCIDLTVLTYCFMGND